MRRDEQKLPWIFDYAAIAKTELCWKKDSNFVGHIMIMIMIIIIIIIYALGSIGSRGLKIKFKNIQKLAVGKIKGFLYQNWGEPLNSYWQKKQRLKF